jgi:hypothetical protein
MSVPPKKALAFSEGTSTTWKHLETAVLAAVEGYHATLDSSSLDELIPLLNQVAPELRGYAYEGAAMGLTCLDCILPWKKHLQAYVAGPAAQHIYMAYVGAGEALALLRRKPEPFIARLEDQLFGWLVMDGYGFHKGFFFPERYVLQQQVPKLQSPYAQQIFDQGLGRSLWFTRGANGERIVKDIARFPETRQSDLWVGIGVGSAYADAGGVGQAELEALYKAAGPYRAHMAVGVALVVDGRLRAGNIVPHTELACVIACGEKSENVVSLVGEAYQDLPTTGPEPAYVLLRQRLLPQFAPQTMSDNRQKEMF